MITNALLSSLRHILTPDYVINDEATCALYGGDRSGSYRLPGAVVLPGNEHETAEVVRVASEAGIKITVRGAATGNVGGAVPEQDGLVLATARLNSPIRVVPDEAVIVAPAGARLAEIAREARTAGFHFGSPLAEYAHGTVGGALARDGDGLGGPTGLLSGHVRGFRAVTARGGIILAEDDGVQGRNLHASGLLIGSEGGLAVITTATLALRHRMPAERIVVASFKDPIAAAEAGVALVAAGLSPVLADVTDLPSWNRVGRWPAAESAEGLLLAWLSGMDVDVEDDTKWTINICRDHLAHHAEVLPEARAREFVALWSRLSQLGPPQQGQIPLDLSVPVAEVPSLLQRLYEEAGRHQIPVTGLVRIPDGVIAMHLPVIPDDGDLYQRGRDFAERMNHHAHEQKGTCLALHGVGSSRLETMRTVHRESNLDAMRAIKRAFDEKGVFSLTPAPAPGGERRNIRERSLRGPQIAEVRETLIEQIEAASATGECLQINAPSAQVMSHIIRLARTQRAPISVHERPVQRLLDVSLAEMKRVTLFDPSSRTFAAEAGITLAEIEEKLSPVGLWWPVSPFISKSLTLSDVLAWEQSGAYALGWGRLRDRITGIEAVTGRGDVVSWGGISPVQHAGLRLCELGLGARNRYALITAAALRVGPQPTTRTCISALFPDLNAAATTVARWLGRAAPRESAKCRPVALCVLAASGAIGEYSDKVTAFAEFAGLPASVERQTRWAKYIADQNKALDIVEGTDEGADEMWSSLADMYQPCPPIEPGNTLYLVVWTTQAKWVFITRMMRHVVHAHGYPCRVLADVGSGRIDVRVEKGAIEPAPLLKLLSEVVLKVGATMEISSSAFAGQWVGKNSSATEELSEDLKLWFDPDDILPAEQGKPFENAPPVEADIEEAKQA